MISAWAYSYTYALFKFNDMSLRKANEFILKAQLELKKESDNDSTMRGNAIDDIVDILTSALTEVTCLDLRDLSLIVCHEVLTIENKSVETLNDELQLLVLNEDYEEAAKIRDEIKRKNSEAE